LAWELTVVDPTTLRPDPENPRRLSDLGLAKLRNSIERFGFVAPVLVQRRSDDGTEPGIVVAGHQRLRAAQEADVREVPAVFLDLTDMEARAYNIADNRLAEESDWAIELLAVRLEELAADAPDLRAVLGFEPAELDRILAAAAPSPPEEFPETSDASEYQCPSCGYEWNGSPK